MSGDAPDTAASSQVVDHDFEAKPGEPWGLCVTCGLSRAAHSDGPTYEADAERAEGLKP